MASNEARRPRELTSPDLDGGAEQQRQRNKSRIKVARCACVEKTAGLGLPSLDRSDPCAHGSAGRDETGGVDREEPTRRLVAKKGGTSREEPRGTARDCEDHAAVWHKGVTRVRNWRGFGRFNLSTEKP